MDLRWTRDRRPVVDAARPHDPHDITPHLMTFPWGLSFFETTKCVESVLGGVVDKDSGADSRSKDVISLAQGVVYWQPPEQALDKVKEIVWDPVTSRYGVDDGLPELREALIEKLRRENKLTKSSVMVTAGANQAFVNLVLALCDSGDSVVMFAPYYFNAYMSFQMTGVTDILVGPGDPETLQPDIDWLERTLSGKDNKPIPKLVTVVNPGNPSGIYIPEPLLQIAYPSKVKGLADQLLKIQDNIPICASIIGQRLALYSLQIGPEWIQVRVQNLVKNREVLKEALSPLGEGAVKGGEGAIYLWAKLPSDHSNDFEVVRWLVRRHGVVVIPGSASGGLGYIRISFGGLRDSDCEIAARRLKRGLEELVSEDAEQKGGFYE
ncbi:Bifunctional aspartate aminotransferase and glutamate/aspartate-prephenate aminotransferase [Acorus calamus]|uniref:Bifunctional aspartate aminotransferase and glutamate/aspartate-prephenate aminotransferase n=1 Tax=Acorus calamus TaxID=4465 RepID=A0AAV9EL27_ACOCL|nr:Bifunctional aspartate aminotransferase and glutamate/aspartate-prephenate aminotransferase [Acorus calamus]